MSDGLVAALARAQGEFEPIKKSKTGKVKGQGKNGPFEYEYQYADLADVMAAVRPVLSRHGIAVVQATEETDRGLMLVTQLRKDSDVIEGRMLLAVGDHATAQQIGSAFTYARRYALCALVGVVAEDDDDGNAASSAKPRQTRRSEPAIDPLLGEFTRLCDALGLETAKDKAGFISAFAGRDAKWSQLTAAQHEAMVGQLTAVANDEAQLLVDNAGRWFVARPGEEPFGAAPPGEGAAPGASASTDASDTGSQK